MGSQRMEGAGSGTPVVAGQSTGEEEKMDSDPEASKVSGSLVASVSVQANGFQMHRLQKSLISSLARESLTTN